MDKAESRIASNLSEAKQIADWKKVRKSGSNFGYKSTYSVMKKKQKKVDYKDYLKTKHWARMRRRTYRIWGKRCFVCSATTDLNVHHMTYENKGREKVKDLIPLCETCHHDLHKVTKIPDIKLIKEYRKEWLEANS